MGMPCRLKPDWKGVRRRQPRDSSCVRSISCSCSVSHPSCIELPGNVPGASEQQRRLRAKSSCHAQRTRSLIGICATSHGSCSSAGKTSTAEAFYKAFRISSMSAATTSQPQACPSLRDYTAEPGQSMRPQQHATSQHQLRVLEKGLLGLGNLQGRVHLSSSQQATVESDNIQTSGSRRAHLYNPTNQRGVHHTRADLSQPLHLVSFWHCISRSLHRSSLKAIFKDLLQLMKGAQQQLGSE